MTAIEQADVVQRGKDAGIGVVDCDVHPYFANGPQALCDYMEPVWQHRLGLDYAQRPGSDKDSVPAFTLPTNFLYFEETASFRRDCSKAGEVPGSDPVFVAEHLFDQYGIDRGILLGGNVMGLGGMVDPDMAAVVAAAHNDWLIEQWLQVDNRYRGSLCIAPQDPEQAAAEIERSGDHPGMVSVLMPLINVPMGDRRFRPIYDAAAAKGLPIHVHPAGTESVFVTGPPMAQRPTYKIEWRTMFPQVHQANLISMICHGVFERNPNLMLVIAEGGFAWLPDVIWRLDASWRALREEVPWVKLPPSEYVKRNVRFTTQPFIEAPRREDVAAMCEIVDAGTTLVFSSDYPHFDFDDPNRALALLPDDQRERVLAGNALQAFGERLL